MRKGKTDFFDYIVEDSKCDSCEFFDPDEENCRAFECNALGFLEGCPPLPCEKEDEDEGKH